MKDVQQQQESDDEDFMSMLHSIVMNDSEQREAVLNIMESIYVLSYEGLVMTDASSIRDIREGKSRAFLLYDAIRSLSMQCECLRESYIDANVLSIEYWDKIVGPYYDNADDFDQGTLRQVGETIIKASNTSITTKSVSQFLDNLHTYTEVVCNGLLEAHEHDPETLFLRLAELPFVSKQAAELALRLFSDPSRNNKFIQKLSAVTSDAVQPEVDMNSGVSGNSGQDMGS